MFSRFRSPLIFSAIVLFVGVFAGTRLGLYDAIPHMDKVLHVAGGLAAAWLAFVLLGADIARMSYGKRLLILVSTAALVSVLWEFAEFASNFTRYASPGFYSYLHGGDMSDTMGDLACDLVGALTLGFMVLGRDRA